MSGPRKYLYSNKRKGWQLVFVDLGKESIRGYNKGFSDFYDPTSSHDKNLVNILTPH